MEAPGGPGAPPMWGPGRKMGFGAAPGSRSKVWYTVADGNLSEVFFPFLAHVARHDLRSFVSAAGPRPPALLLQQQDIWICVVGPFSRANVGYFRSSDVHIDLTDADGHLTYTYDRAGPGNVSAGAEIGIRAGAFQLAIGFAHSRADAEEVARTALQKGAGAVRQSFERAWRAQPEIPPALGKVSGDDGMLARASFALLHCLEDKSHAGAFIAAPASPWGEHNHDGNHVYHLVWPRDLC